MRDVELIDAFDDAPPGDFIDLDNENAIKFTNAGIVLNCLSHFNQNRYFNLTSVELFYLSCIGDERELCDLDGDTSPAAPPFSPLISGGGSP